MKNRYFVSGDITVIEIKNNKYPEKTFYTVIDTCNLQKVLENSIRLTVSVEPHTNYAICYTKDKKTVGLHRILLNTPKEMIVDHRNHNGLDNRESNIWNCTHTENNNNKRFHNNKNPDYIKSEYKAKRAPVKEIEDYPEVLTVHHLREILTIGRNTAYDLMDEEGFPTYRDSYNQKRVNREDFFNWLSEQSRTNIS